MANNGNQIARGYSALVSSLCTFAGIVLSTLVLTGCLVDATKISDDPVLPELEIAFTNIPLTPTVESTKIGPTATKSSPISSPSPMIIPTFSTSTFEAAPLSPHVGTQYNTPPTLMLHESHEGFDAPEFLRQILFASAQRNMHTVTYSQLVAKPELLANGASDLLIITIDDISLQAKIDPSIQEMITILLEVDAVAVLGIVTEGDAPDPETAATLRDLYDRGWEIATHGDTHRNLHEIEVESPGHVRFDIRDSKNKILEAVGVEPNVLILPYGQMVDNARLLYKEGIKWAVGISGGHTLDLTDRVIYVGRQSPTGSGEETLQIMLRPYYPDN